MKRSTIKAGKFQECPLCNESKAENQFMILSKCKHTFCKPCLQRYSIHYGSADARCPYQACDELLNEAERQNIPKPTSNLKSWKFWKSKEKSLPPTKVTIVQNSTVDAKRRNSAENYTGMWVNLDQTNESQFYSKSEEEILLLTKKEEFPKLSDTVPKTANQQNNLKRGSTDGFHNDPIENRWNLNPTKNTEISITKDSNSSRQSKVWDADARIHLLQLIKDKLHKVIDFMFLAIEADILLNTNQIDCLMCGAVINAFEGISFPYCSHTFCRICLSKANGTDLMKFADDIIVLYSNNEIKNKNCAIILNADIRSLLFDSRRFAQFQQKFGQKISLTLSNIDIPTIPDSGNTNFPDFENTLKDSKAAIPLISFNTPPKETIVKPKLTRHSLTDVVLLRNSKPTACLKCNIGIPVRKGVILRDCYHVLCERCLIDTIMKTLDYNCVEIRCPMVVDDKRWCVTVIQEREIKSLLNDEQYERYERKCLESAQGQFESSARCFKPNCTGWIVFEGYKDSFICPVCGNQNCLSCKAIHHGKSCSGYRKELEKHLAKDLKNIIRCPNCSGTNVNPPMSNFYRCLDCTNVFNIRKDDSK